MGKNSLKWHQLHLQNRCIEAVVLWLSIVEIFLIKGVRDQVTPERGAQYLSCYSYSCHSDHFWSDPTFSFITPIVGLLGECNNTYVASQECHGV